MLKFMVPVALGFAAPVLATPHPSAPSFSVRVADLNLASAQGQRRLDQRLASAVRHVCRTTDAASARTALDARTCRLEASRTAEQARARVLARDADVRVAAATAGR